MKKTTKARNIGKKVIGLVTAAVMSVSLLTAGGISASASNYNPVQNAAYSASYSNQTITLNVSSEWASYNADVWAYFFNCVNNQNEWVKTQNRGYMGTYVNVPGDYTHVIFVRFPDGTTNPKFENAWNKTDDLKISDLNGSYTINGWEKDAVQSSAKEQSKQSIKLNVSSEWASYNADIWAYFFNSVNNQHEWVKTENKGYMGTYVNIPGNYTHVIFVRFPAGTTNPKFENAWNKTDDLKISDLNGSYTINGWEKDA